MESNVTPFSHRPDAIVNILKISRLSAWFRLDVWGCVIRFLHGLLHVPPELLHPWFLFRVCSFDPFGGIEIGQAGSARKDHSDATDERLRSLFI